jgi:hypothetical protein
MGVFIFRILIVALISITGYFFPPFNLSRYYGILTGFLLSVLIVYLETRIRKSQFKVIWGGTL